MQYIVSSSTMIGDFFMRQSEAVKVKDIIDQVYNLIDQAESKLKAAEDHGADLDYAENHFQELFLTIKNIEDDCNQVLQEEAA